MPTKLDRLMFAQGGQCFFCKKPLPRSEASVEHLVASANGGANSNENCVACCKALNALLGSMSLKEKIQVVLNQNGKFRCPNGAGAEKTAAPAPDIRSSGPNGGTPTSERLAAIVADLHKRGPSKPRKVSTLAGTIRALFQKQLSEQEVASLLESLRDQGVVLISGTKVSYALPPKVS
jgi:hypothetical protein